MQLTEVDLTSFTFGLCCTLITLWMWCAFSHFFKIISSLKEKMFYIKIAVVRYLPKCKILVETRYFVPYCSWNNSLGVDLYWLCTDEWIYNTLSLAGFSTALPTSAWNHAALSCSKVPLRIWFMCVLTLGCLTLLNWCQVSLSYCLEKPYNLVLWLN